MENIEKTIAEKREKTDLILNNIYNLPALPKALIEVNKLLDNPNTTATELSKAISLDQAFVYSKFASLRFAAKSFYYRFCDTYHWI